MSAVDAIRALASGERPAGGLLHNARMTGFGTDHYGIEAIVDAFRAAPMRFADPIVIAREGHLALFEGAAAIVADLHGPHVGRLWRLGAGPLLPTEPAIDVAFDPDCDQAGGSVFADAADHPALAGEALAHVHAAGERIAANRFRTRAFAIRAFGDAGEGAALFAVHRLSEADPRRAGFSHVAAYWNGDGLGFVRDGAGEAAVAQAPWSPRVPH